MTGTEGASGRSGGGITKNTRGLIAPIVRLKARPCVTFEFSGGRVTEKELRALEAVGAAGKQLEAARRLDVSIAVLHRRVASAEAKVGEPLVVAGNRGTRLTAMGRELVNSYTEFTSRSSAPTSTIVAVTPISEHRVHRALSRIERERRRVSVIVGDDETNVRLFLSGQVDLLLLDDPQFAYDSFRDHPVNVVGNDTLLLFDRGGEEFARYRYGPQRLGFEYLSSIGRPFTVVRFVSDIDSLLESDLSFFLNESLVLRRGSRVRGLTGKPVAPCTLIALVHEDSEAKVTGLLKELGRPV